MKDFDKKRILILGAGGMLGHKLCQLYKQKYDLYYTVRSNFAKYQKYDIFDKERMIENLDVLDLDKVVNIFNDIKPDIVINCVGIIKQLKDAKDPILSIRINSLLPHQLAKICQPLNAKLFHISTDCVFNGKDGMYTEKSISNAEDLYGRTKYLGEVSAENALTIRTSIIGRELATANGLVEWFLANRNGKVKGFKQAIYVGFTTIAMAEIIEFIIEKHANLSGLYQISSEPIDKFSLLNIIKDKFGLKVEIESENEIKIDRSLDSSKFRNLTGFVPPTWEQMIENMADDSTPYDEWHNYNNA